MLLTYFRYRITKARSISLYAMAVPNLVNESFKNGLFGRNPATTVVIIFSKHNIVDWILFVVMEVMLVGNFCSVTHRLHNSRNRLAL